MPKMTKILKDERNPDKTYIEYDENLHKGKPTKLIRKDTFEHKKTDCKPITVLRDKKNTDGTYIKFDNELHQGQATKVINYNTYRLKIRNREKVCVLRDNMTPEGAYIKFDPRLHKGEPTTKVKVPTFKANLKRAAHNNTSGSQVVSNQVNSRHSFFADQSEHSVRSIRARMNINNILIDKDEKSASHSLS